MSRKPSTPPISITPDEQAALARAMKALRAAESGEGLMGIDEFLAGMQQRAEAAQARIREASMAKAKAKGAIE